MEWHKEVAKMKEAAAEMAEEGGGKMVNLGLGIGYDNDHNDGGAVVGKNKKMKNKCGGGGGGSCSGGGFAAGQLHELQQQALIYKHLAANLPVPFQLLLPIWNSVAASYAHPAAIYKQFPSFTGFRPLGFDYGNQMDPEPGRCRRTDGKKWRCSKNVVPDQKYCEQHMHRGRHRSRKHVENSEVASPSRKKTIKNNAKDELSNLKTSLQISTPKGLQSSSTTSVSHGTTSSSTGDHECKRNITSVTTASIAGLPATRATTAPAVVATTATARPTTATNGISYGCNLNIGVKGNVSNNAGDTSMARRSINNRNNINVGRNMSPGFGISPKSVLQGRRTTVPGCNGLYFENRSGEELEPGRCRRTDGKKWRCRRDVLPDQKYCGRHIHRGVKRQMTDHQPASAPSTSAAPMNTARLSLTTSIARETACAIPSTNLSMSIPESTPLIQNDEKSNSISDSDTTITDTSLTGYDSAYVSA